jgi:hypothetical protein
MSDKISNINDTIKKKDLELILEVNRKAIEIETDVVEQNEEIMDTLTKINRALEEHDRKLDKVTKHVEETSKDVFKIQVLFVTGLLSLIVQIITIFIKK